MTYKGSFRGSLKPCYDVYHHLRSMNSACWVGSKAIERELYFSPAYFSPKCYIILLGEIDIEQTANTCAIIWETLE